MKTFFTVLLLVFGLLSSVCSPVFAKGVISKTGLKYEDTKPGTGPTAQTGKMVSVQYTGWIYENGKKGRKFDSSLERNEPLVFKLGAKQVIAGWDEGISGMKVGGTRTLIIPAKLAYGKEGANGVIPPNSDLIFDVELVGVK